MPNHYIRFGTHAEKKFFYGIYSDYYDGIFINGNMLAYTPKSMVSFLLQINNDKRILIDPQTHAFQHDVDLIRNKKGVDVKSSLSSLAEYYGEPISTCLLNNTPAIPSVFTDEIMEKFCRNVGKFQLDTILNTVDGLEEKRYIDFAKEEQTVNDVQNITDIVAPYFYIESIDSPWIDLNIKLVNKTKEVFNNNTVIGQIVISAQLLNNPGISTLLAKYKTCLCDEYFIWIDGFSEDEQNTASLKNFIYFISELSKTNRPVTNLYGGYFSIILSKFLNGFSAVSHGLEYGESRKVVPVGGGLPMSKYYFWPLHRRIKQEMFINLLAANNWSDLSTNQDFENIICNCQSCKDIDKFFDSYPVKRGGRTFNYPTTKAKEHSLKHYLYCKKKEFEYITNTELNEILLELKKAHDTYSPQLDRGEVDYLLNWKNAIEQSLQILS
jgi:hypothetical protein